MAEAIVHSESSDESVPANLSVVVLLHEDDWSDHLADLTKSGLTDDQPWTPPVWFYDEVGSELFDQITRLPEYYPTRAERAILAEYAGEIIELANPDTLVELGAGSSEKTQLLLTAADDQGLLRAFVPVDCSHEFLAAAAADVAAAYPHVEVRAVVADFNAHLSHLGHSERRMVLFLGSTIGNFDDPHRLDFLTSVAEDLGPGDTFLLGTDLIKDPARLVAAYDDAAGVTAAFNENATRVMNRQLGANFDVSQFRHRAVWEPVKHRIEMHLVAQSDQEVRFNGLDGLEVQFAQGQHLQTEISTKFTRDIVDSELRQVGLKPIGHWSDDGEDFLLTLSRLRR